MRKKVMAAVLTAAMVASVSAMPQMVAAADDEFKIGLITDVGGVKRWFLQPVSMGGT